MDDLGDIVAEFLAESHENLDQLDRDLVALEQSPGSRALLSSIFRTIHTIKGTSGFLAFHRLERLSHAGESLLARLRDGIQPMTPATVETLLHLVDTVRAMLRSVERDGTDDGGDIDAVVAAVARCTEPPSMENSSLAPAPLEPAAAEQRSLGDRRAVVDSSIRVDVELLDGLMRLVGELVLVRNQLTRSLAESGDTDASRAAQRLKSITGELQESVMKTRLQAIDHVWSKLPRLVRDVSTACGKRVRLALSGRDTELDRSLIEAVKDPLIHLVRNAIDHGIETPAERVAAGKSPEGVLTLRAFHDGGHVVVEVGDDGAGMDPARIGRTALERGFVTADQLAGLDPAEIVRLVFRAGFSTATSVTNVSGRGVGMDVVKTNIEHIGGTVDVRSVPGAGTTWRLTIPLTLAIIQALIVESAGQRYVLPQAAVNELVYLDGQPGRSVEYAMGVPVYRLRGRLLPLVHLDRALGLEDRPGGRGAYVAVLQAEGHRFGLVVDRVSNIEDVVVKPLSARFKDIGVYAGATILGDGRVALILEAAALARRAHAVATTDRVRTTAPPEVPPGGRPANRMLIAGVGRRRVAIPLEMVTRLEEFPRHRIEWVGEREVVQYRGRILPVVHLSRILGGEGTEGVGGGAPAGESVPVVVYAAHGRTAALAVDRIIDIVEFGDTGGTGDDAYAVIGQRVTELVDVRRAIRAADPTFEFAGPLGAALSGAPR